MIISFKKLFAYSDSFKGFPPTLPTSKDEEQFNSKFFTVDEKEQHKICQTFEFDESDERRVLDIGLYIRLLQGYITIDGQKKFPVVALRVVNDLSFKHKPNSYLKTDSRLIDYKTYGICVRDIDNAYMYVLMAYNRPITLADPSQRKKVTETSLAEKVELLYNIVLALKNLAHPSDPKLKPIHIPPIDLDNIVVSQNVVQIRSVWASMQIKCADDNQGFLTRYIARLNQRLYKTMQQPDVLFCRILFGDEVDIVSSQGIICREPCKKLADEMHPDLFPILDKLSLFPVLDKLKTGKTDICSVLEDLKALREKLNPKTNTGAKLSSGKVALWSFSEHRPAYTVCETEVSANSVYRP